jgi:hypothetical protein
MTHTNDLTPHDLPFWMRQATRGWDWGLLLAVIFSLIAAWPFLLQPGLPRTNASENHVFMAQDFSDALREGRLYPRWSPHVLGGYGAPIPNYYPPGAAYVTAVIKVLFTNDVVQAARIVYAIAFGIAGASLYVLVSRRSTPGAALLAVILFVYSPYFANTAPHILGDLPGVIGLALLSAVLAFLDRLLTFNQPQDVLLTALCVGALALTHTTLLAVGAALSLVFVVDHLVRRGRRVPWLAAIAALLLGVGMTGFFWIPAVAEQHLIVWYDRPMSHRPIMTLEELFRPLRPIDLAELAPAPQMKVGLVILAFTVIGVLSAILVRKRIAFHMMSVVLGIALLVSGVAALPTQVSLLGAATLCLSMGGSAVTALQERLNSNLARLVLPIASVIALAGSVTAWLPPRWPESFGGTQPLDQILYEQQGAGIAILPPGAPIPATIAPSLSANRFLITGYQSGNINKIAPTQGVSNRIVNVVSHTTHADRFQVQLDTRTQLDILTAYFPGWEAWVNNAPIRVNQNAQNGLMSIDAPRMSGEIALSLNPTPAQQNAWYVSWAVLLLALVLTLRRVRRRTGQRDVVGVVSHAEVRLMLVVLVGFVGLILLAAAPFAPLTLYPRPGYALDNAMAVRSRSDTGLEALAFRLEDTRYQPGERLDLTLYWQAVRTLPDNYQVQVYLLDPDDGLRWHRTDYTTPASYPTRRWRTYAYVTDSYTLDLSETIVAGDYQLAVEVFVCDPTCDPDQRLTFYNAAGISVGQTLILPTTVTVMRP